MQSLLFCRQDRLGDVMLSLPLAAAVKKKDPSIRIGFLVNQGIGDLVATCREVDDVWEAAPGSKLDKTKLREWDTVVALWPNRALAWQLFTARIPRRVGTGRRAYSVFFNEKIPLHRHASGKHETTLNFELLDGILRTDHAARPTFTVPGVALQEISERLTQLGVLPSYRLAVLHPGSGGSSRDWPIENFEAVAEILHKRSDTFVVITGSREERKLAAQIAKLNPKKIVPFAGDTTLLQLQALLSLSSLCIANSTGPLHLANALGVPTIGVFPPLADCGPERWGVLDHPERSLLPEFPDTDCPFCKEFSCPKGQCMGLISPERILEIAEPLLGNEPIWSTKFQTRCAGQ
ncbi:MAG: glycosyltransferase family 9 protein [bacterium]|nr:glycosyltransferase family 9 protein [bacterium]